MHGFGDRGVGEDGVHEVGFRGLQGSGDGVALDHLGDLGADHVGAEEFAGGGVEDGLHQAVGFAHGDGLAVADEGEAADLDLVAFGLGLGFGHADGGDLRP